MLRPITPLALASTVRDQLAPSASPKLPNLLLEGVAPNKGAGAAGVGPVHVDDAIPLVVTKTFVVAVLGKRRVP